MCGCGSKKSTPMASVAGAAGGLEFDQTPSTGEAFPFQKLFFSGWRGVLTIIIILATAWLLTRN